MKSNVAFNTILFGFVCALYLCLAQQNDIYFDKQVKTVIWCTVGVEEQKKCLAFANATHNDTSRFGYDFINIQCKQAFNKDECMTMLDELKAHITNLDAGEVFIGGRYHSLIPIMQEVYPGNLLHYYSVAVVKKGTLTDVTNLRQLRGKKACFPEVGSQAGWVIPVHTLMRDGGMEIVDCNNHVKSTINYFGPSCAVNSLVNKYNPIGDNKDKLCQLCIGKVPGGKCTSADPYAGFEGAFKCLVEKGDIAFLKHTTVKEMTESQVDFVSLTTADFELLCKDGSKKPVEMFKECNWGEVPTHAIVTSSATEFSLKRKFQLFMRKAIQLYGSPAPNVTFPTTTSSYNGFNAYNDYSSSSTTPPSFSPYTEANVLPFVNTTDHLFHLFESAPRYGYRHSLLIQDSAIDLKALDETRQTYAGYLGRSLDTILSVRQCPVNRMTLCVTSDAEFDKCVKMKAALKAQLLAPEMFCYKGHSQIHCMQAIRSGNADVSVFDAGDIYTAGLKYDLIPFIAEVYNLGKPEYYVVAVAKEEDPTTELTYLKGKNTCHSGINTAAGWIIPLAYLISNGWMRSYGCDSIKAAAEYFTKSCVPGAISTEYNTGVPYDNMCHLCHGTSFRYCRRDASEDYYGFTGAFRCLVEGGGDVAFVKHTTVMENTDGKRKEWWARNTLNEDFELLCPDGTRSVMHDFKRCNLGKAKANAIVTRGGEAYNHTELNAYINLFIYAQQFYGRKDQNDFSFSMFYSPPPHSDLIFQDAAQQLQVIKPSERYYSTYLGKDFMRAKRVVDCHAGVQATSASSLLTVLATLLTSVVAFLLGRGVF
ncbi:melanotransferrin [Nilaparvata lugens]|uniref:melanotransferrin n=1 Tax=Nilaparvata lugens TaxID=108931 RepID=UPI00193DA7F3|nr:melanotransferrin [Nilaparvata lugens]XP_039275548.1 melanotransferrin [Nilaparvata lugens]